jgi:hypothetical protein
MWSGDRRRRRCGRRHKGPDATTHALHIVAMSHDHLFISGTRREYRINKMNYAQSRAQKCSKVKTAEYVRVLVELG